MTNTSKKRLIKAVKEIAKQKPTTIEVEVALEALSHNDVPTFFEDLLNYGCISGMVTSLIYYSDTHRFFEQHYDEIEELREEYEESTGCTLEIKNDLKNFLAWFAFEEVARQMYERFS